MLTDRITSLFQVLGCNNSDIARCAGCSPSYIRLIHSNKRNYSPNDKPVALLADAIYSFADKSDQLKLLAGLCKITGSSRELLFPAIIALLFDTDEKALKEVKAFSGKRKKEEKSKSFGAKLGALMELLELSNARLARKINVDDSYISRFRGGVRAPIPGSEIAGLLSEALYQRVCEQRRLPELSKQTGIIFTPEMDRVEALISFSEWLYNMNGPSEAMAIDRLLECLDSFSPQTKTPLPELSDLCSEECFDPKESYDGIDGMRKAVLRFLFHAAKKGGELWLYSDESIDWMVGDKLFFSKWYALMLACVKNRVKIKIIHNIDRGTEEMISAISSWMPLYMSGMIEPYVCRKGRDTRFTHTLFLRKGVEGIRSFHIRGQEKRDLYEYVTDEKWLDIMENGLSALFSQSEPLVRIAIGDSSGLFRSYEAGKKMYALLPSLSLGTLPESLLCSILSSRRINENDSCKIKEFCVKQRELVKKTLQKGTIYEFVRLPEDSELFQGTVRLNLAPTLYPDDIFYTPEEYAEHVAAVDDLLSQNISYRVYVITELPFDDIQIISTEKEVTVIKQSAQRAAFVFTEPTMLRAFSDYFSMLMKQHDCDRSVIRKMLRRFM